MTAAIDRALIKDNPKLYQLCQGAVNYPSIRKDILIQLKRKITGCIGPS